LVSAGYDAASGHPAPLGGYNVTPACFAYMTQQLMQIADGKVKYLVSFNRCSLLVIISYLM